MAPVLVGRCGAGFRGTDWPLRRRGVPLALLRFGLDLVGFERLLVGTMTSWIAFVHENELLNSTPPPRFVMPGCDTP